MAETIITDNLLKQQFNNLAQQTLQDKSKSAKNQDYLKNNNAVEKKLVLKPYTTTRIKARNFLSNIAYNSVIDQDIFTKTFCFDTYVLVTKNLNLLSLERKITGQSKHEAIFMLWKNCMPKIVSWCLLQQRTVRFRFEKQISNKT